MSNKPNIFPNLSESDKNRFWSKVEFTANPDKCWNWTGSVLRGYGKFCITIAPNKEVNIIASRMAYLLHNIDPVEKLVLHRCDNPTCCNPSHLFLGSNDDNTQDMMKKGRGIHPKGSHHGRSKLTESIVIEIRKKYADGIKKRNLELEYNVDCGQMSRILNKKAWRHI